jgi:hypothetical protein
MDGRIEGSIPLQKGVDLFAAVLRGEHAIIGFRNCDILHQHFSTVKDLST